MVFECDAFKILELYIMYYYISKRLIYQIQSVLSHFIQQ